MSSRIAPLQYSSIEELVAKAETIKEPNPTEFAKWCSAVVGMKEAGQKRLKEGKAEDAYVFLFRVPLYYSKLKGMKPKTFKPGGTIATVWKGLGSTTIEALDLAEKIKPGLLRRYREKQAAAAAVEKAAEAVAAAVTSPSSCDGAGGDLADVGLEPMPDLPLMPGVPDTLTNTPTISTPEILRRLNQISNSLNAGPPIAGPVDVAMPQVAEDPAGTDSVAPMDIGGNQPETTMSLGAAVDASSSPNLLVPLDVGGTAGGISVPGAPQGYAGIGLVTPEDLYRHLGDPENDSRRLLLIDIRDADDFRVSHIEYEYRVNIPPSWLVQGMIADTIEKNRLKGKMRRRFGDRHQYETVVLVGLDPGDIVHPPRDYMILIDAMLQYEPSKRLKRPPLCVAGGYVNFYETYPSSCSGAPRRVAKAPVAKFSVPAMSYPTAPKISSRLLVVEDLPPSPEPVPQPSVDLHMRRLSSSTTPKVPTVPKPAKPAEASMAVRPLVPIADQWVGEYVGAAASAVKAKLATPPQQIQPLTPAPAPAPAPLVDLGVSQAITAAPITEAPPETLLDIDFGSPVSGPSSLPPAELTKPKRMPPVAPVAQSISAVSVSRPLGVTLPASIVTGFKPSAPAELSAQAPTPLQQDQQSQIRAQSQPQPQPQPQPPLLDVIPAPEPIFLPSPAATPESKTPPQAPSGAYAQEPMPVPVPVPVPVPTQEVFQPPATVLLPSRHPPAPPQTPTRIPPQTVAALSPVGVAAYNPPLSPPWQQSEEVTRWENPPITPPQQTMPLRPQSEEINRQPQQRQQQRQQPAVKPSRLPPQQPIAKLSRLPSQHVTPTRPPQSRPPLQAPSYDTINKPRSTPAGYAQPGRRPSVPSKENRPPSRPSVNRGAKPAAAGSGRLSQQMRNARMQSMDAVFGSPCQALTGLRNLGNTCFMNCVLQCMVATTPLVKYFVQGRYRNDINRCNALGHKGELAIEFGELANVMWSQRNRYVVPRMFKSSISKLNPQFAGTQQHDCQEFCAFLLDGLHEDLNRVTKKEYVELPDNEGVPDHVAGPRAWELHRRRNQSMIVDHFQGQFKSKLTCCHCNHSSVTFSPFTFLSLPVGRAHKVRLEDCIKAFSETELVTGDDRWHCPKCKTHRDAKKSIAIWKLPRILVIHLKRFYFEGPFRSKLNTAVYYPTKNLQLGPHCLGKHTGGCYNLYSVANHIGDMNGGHYTAYCQNAFNQRWYEFNDSTVTELPASRLCTSDGYLLFYSSMDFEDHTDLFG